MGETRQHEMPKDNNGSSVQVLGFKGSTYSLTSGGVATHTPVISADAESVVRVFSDNNIYIAIDEDAVASSNDAILPASGVEYFKVPAGARVSVLQADTGGVVRVSHMG